MNWSQAELYAATMRRQFNPPRKSGLVVTSAEHVGEAPAASNETWEIAEEIKSLVEMTQNAHPDQMWDLMRQNVGPIWDYAQQIQDLNPKAEGGTPPPNPSPSILNEYGTYHGHGLAVDMYPLGRGYNSKGFVRTLPIDVRLEAYQFQGPLTQWSPAPLPYEEELAALAITLGTSLHTRVARPVGPLRGGLTGREIKAFWVTHTAANGATGPCIAGEPAWIVSDSGIEFERLGIKADAAHEHWAISYSGQLSPNGEGDPTDLFAAFGWNRRNVGQVPGPQEYLGRRGWRGLLQAPPA